MKSHVWIIEVFCVDKWEPARRGTNYDQHQDAMG